MKSTWKMNKNIENKIGPNWLLIR